MTSGGFLIPLFPGARRKQIPRQSVSPVCCAVPFSPVREIAVQMRIYQPNPKRPL